MAKRYRALRGLNFRKRPDPDCQEEHRWEAGEVFTAPAHMNVEVMLESGKIEEVKEDGETKRTRR